MEGRENFKIPRQLLSSSTEPQLFSFHVVVQDEDGKEMHQNEKGWFLLMNYS